jgi:hypothetical protein
MHGQKNIKSIQQSSGVPVSLVRIYAMLLLVAVGNKSLRLVVGVSLFKIGPLVQ